MNQSLKPSCRITAMGMLSPLGNGPKESLENLIKGESRLNKVPNYLVESKDVIVGETAKPQGLPDEWSKFDSHTTRLIYSCYTQIKAEIDVALGLYPKHRVALIIGTSTGDMSGVERAFFANDLGQPDPNFEYPAHEISALSKILREILKIEGPCYTISTACSSSANALISASKLIESGLCDAVIVGGVDSLCKMTTNGFNSLGLISKDKNTPFMQDRTGLNIGEAAALALLEKKTGGIQLLGYGQSADAHHMSAPEPEGKGAEAAMLAAIKKAGLQASDVDYINLHGTGTILNDQAEAKAVMRVFGESSPCSSTKSLTGHTLGTAGILECALAYLTLKQTAFTAHWPKHMHSHFGVYDQELPKIHLAGNEDLIPTDKRACVLSNSFAFGGNNSSLVISREEA
ncbi:MAG: beta-ketoacyl-ACP synthase [SAR324 cluster bacterium]|nr:beta-ketoacyl-ACP synthase [SAR324 cluster bacterium]